MEGCDAACVGTIALDIMGAVGADIVDMVDMVGVNLVSGGCGSPCAIADPVVLALCRLGGVHRCEGVACVPLNDVRWEYCAFVATLLPNVDGDGIVDESTPPSLALY